MPLHYKASIVMVPLMSNVCFINLVLLFNLAVVFKSLSQCAYIQDGFMFFLFVMTFTCQLCTCRGELLVEAWENNPFCAKVILNRFKGGRPIDVP